MIFSSVEHIHHPRPSRPWAFAKQQGQFPECVSGHLSFVSIATRISVIFRVLLNFLVGKGNKALVHMAQCSCVQHFGCLFDSGGYACNNSHAMECSLTINRPDVMVSIICNILHEVPCCESIILCFLCYCSTSFVLVYL